MLPEAYLQVLQVRLPIELSQHLQERRHSFEIFVLSLVVLCLIELL